MDKLVEHLQWAPTVAPPCSSNNQLARVDKSIQTPNNLTFIGHDSVASFEISLARLVYRYYNTTEWGGILPPTPHPPLPSHLLSRLTKFRRRSIEMFARQRSTQNHIFPKLGKYDVLLRTFIANLSDLVSFGQDVSNLLSVGSRKFADDSYVILRDITEKREFFLNCTFDQSVVGYWLLDWSCFSFNLFYRSLRKRAFSNLQAFWEIHALTRASLGGGGFWPPSRFSW